MKLLVLSCFVLAASCESIYIGEITTKAHGVGGKVSVYNESTIVVDNFKYDGAGPDAFFIVGTSDTPGDTGTILPYPFKGQFFEFFDKSAPILVRKFDDEKIVLTLPSDLEAADLRWLAVWCRAYTVNFGDIFFPENLDASSEPEQKLPSPISPTDGNHLDNHHYDHDADAESESEPESHAESEPSSSMRTSFSLVLLFFVLSVMRLR